MGSFERMYKLIVFVEHGLKTNHNFLVQIWNDPTSSICLIFHVVDEVHLDEFALFIPSIRQRTHLVIALSLYLEVSLKTFLLYCFCPKGSHLKSRVVSSDTFQEPLGVGTVSFHETFQWFWRRLNWWWFDFTTQTA